MVGTAASIATDFVSRRAIAVAGAFGLTISLALFATADSFTAAAFASFLWGAAGTALIDSCEVALADEAGDDLRPMLARTNLGGVVGDLLGPAALVVAAALGLSWRVPLAIAAVLMGLYALALAKVRFPPPDRTHTEDHTPARAIAAVLRDRRVWWLGFFALLTAPLDEDFLAFVLAFLEQVRGLSASAATFVALVSVSGGVVAFTVGARLVRGLSDRRVMVLCALTMTGGAVAIVAVPSLATTLLGAFAVGVGLNLCWLALQHRTLTLRPGQAGTTMALVNTIEFAAFAVPIAIGALADAAGLATGLWAYALVPAALLALVLLDAPARGADEPVDVEARVR
jgi:predicted MFS family arabinose efflux permease